jgi:hypothetical protein
MENGDQGVDWKLIVSIVSAVIACGSLLYSWSRNRKADRERRGSLDLYVIECYRQSLIDGPDQRVVMANAQVTNRASRAVSFTCTLEVEYLSSTDIVHRAVLAHDASLLGRIGNKGLRIPEEGERVDSDSIFTGWFLFAIPAPVLRASRIERYRLRLKDTIGREAESSIYLIKDVRHESDEP